MSDTKKVVVRWSAVFETEIEVPADATDQDIKWATGDISVHVPGSEYQSDTWEVEGIREGDKLRTL